MTKCARHFGGRTFLEQRPPRVRHPARVMRPLDSQAYDRIGVRFYPCLILYGDPPLRSIETKTPSDWITAPPPPCPQY